MYVISCSDKELKKRMLECDELTPLLLKEIIQRYKRVQLAQRLINLEIPVLVRSLKSSNVELG